MIHDRHLEEPPEHPDDCGCRECRAYVRALDRSLGIGPACEELLPDDDYNAPEIVASRMRATAMLGMRNPVSDTHLCSGGPEEITDEEWEARAAELRDGDACPN